MRVPVLLVIGLLVTGLLASGCASDAGEPESAEHPTVLAAASLTDAFSELGGAELQFGGSQALVRQLRDGARADVVATADQASMQALVGDGLVDRPVTFARNRLAIAVAPGNPKHVRSLDDLADPALVVVLADPSVPVGRYSARVLDRAGVEVRARSFELDVKAVLTKVTLGEADAGIVYATDVGGDRSVAIPAADNVVAAYPVAVVRDGDQSAAHAYIRRLLGAEGRAVLRRHGFLAAQ